jgi:hypothetical protein
MQTKSTKIALFFSHNEELLQSLVGPGPKFSKHEALIFVTSHPGIVLSSACKLLDKNKISYEVGDDFFGIMGFLSVKKIPCKTIIVSKSDSHIAHSILEEYLNTLESENSEQSQTDTEAIQTATTNADPENTAVFKTPSSSSYWLPLLGLLLPLTLLLIRNCN